MARDIRKLTSELKKMEKADRHREILNMLDSKNFSAFELIPKCISDRAFLIELLAKGVEEADASQIGYWLKAIIQRLGFQRTVRSVHRLLEVNPKGVQRTLYWLPQLCPADEKKSVLALNKLLEEAQVLKLYPLPSTAQAPGRNSELTLFVPWMQEEDT